jgi:hypothetical protein
MIRTSKIFGLCLALVAVAGFATVNPSTAQATDRPLSDFLSTQGTTSTFDAPIPDFWGWTNNNPQNLFAGVDYAGLAANYLLTHGGRNLGTTLTGGITETLMANGTYEVVITVNGKNVNAWVSPLPGNVATDPTVFGNRPSALLTNPNTPVALVNTSLKITFIATVAGAPIPDMSGPVPYTLKNVKFSASGPGPLADGSTGKLKVIQSGLFNTQWKGAVSDGFPAETISIK